MCKEAVRREPYTLSHVPDYFMTQEMCIKAMCKNPAVPFLVPDRFKTQEMCEKAVEVDPWSLCDVPDYLKTQKICDDAVWGDPSSLQFVPDQFVTQQQLKIWDDYDDFCNDDEFIEWYDGYKKRKAKKAKIKEESMSIAWHPLIWWDWCVSADKKRDRKIVEVADKCFKII